MEAVNSVANIYFNWRSLCQIIMSRNVKVRKTGRLLRKMPSVPPQQLVPKLRLSGFAVSEETDQLDLFVSLYDGVDLIRAFMTSIINVFLVAKK